MNGDRRIIVELGLQRQQISLTNRFVSFSTLFERIGHHFHLDLEKNSNLSLQMFDYKSSEFYPLDHQSYQLLDTVKELKNFHRFRIVQSQKQCLLQDLQMTVDKLQDATRNIDQIQNLVGTLNQNCEILNQLMKTRTVPSPSTDVTSYLIDPSVDAHSTPVLATNESDDENFESVSCFQSVIMSSKEAISIPISRNKPALLTAQEHFQTRIIPCKYAVRGHCPLGDQCLYLHDEECIRSAREWERRS